MAVESTQQVPRFQPQHPKLEMEKQSVLFKNNKLVLERRLSG